MDALSEATDELLAAADRILENIPHSSKANSPQRAEEEYASDFEPLDTFQPLVSLDEKMEKYLNESLSFSQHSKKEDVSISQDVKPALNDLKSEISIRPTTADTSIDLVELVDLRTTVTQLKSQLKDAKMMEKMKQQELEQLKSQLKTLESMLDMEQQIRQSMESVPKPVKEQQTVNAVELKKEIQELEALIQGVNLLISLN
jgi:hypothetical protein